MRFLETDSFLPELEKMLKHTTKIDISVAWATSCPALDMIEDWARSNNENQVRAIVGIDGNSTQPYALERLYKFSDLMLCSKSNGIFHHKFYLFHSPQRCICWIGSPNLSNAAFNSNAEVVCEFYDAGEAAEWFEKLWNNGRIATDIDIKKYTSTWTPPARGAGSSKPAIRTIGQAPELHPITLFINKRIKTWTDFYEGLKYCESYWADKGHSVFNEYESWMATAKCARQVINKTSWKTLSRSECNILLGNGKSKENFGFYGAMSLATLVSKRFIDQDKESIKFRRDIKNILNPLMECEDHEWIELAKETLKNLRSIPRVGPGVATRLITLARPDKAISINNASRHNITQIPSLNHLPTTTGSLATPKNYEKILDWIYSQKWYQSPKPNDPIEQEAWSIRASLIDCFLYIPTEKKKKKKNKK